MHNCLTAGWSVDECVDANARTLTDPWADYDRERTVIIAGEAVLTKGIIIIIIIRFVKRQNVKRLPWR